MSVKEFFDRANAVEYGMRRAMEDSRRAGVSSDAIRDAQKSLQDSERMLAEMKAERDALAASLFSAGLSYMGETVNETRDRLAAELSSQFSRLDAMLADSPGALDAALLAELSAAHERVHRFNKLVPVYDAVII